MAPKKKYTTTQQERFIRMEANGYSAAEIIREVFGTEKGDPDYHAKECIMSRWRALPAYDEIWRDETRKQDYSDYSAARRTLRRTMASSDDWLSMQSAVNVLSNTGKRIYRDDDSTITVKLEGMPDLGSPDQEE